MLPTALIPTLAINVTPPVVAGNAYFTLTGGRIDVLAYILAGYAVLMVLVQLRLFPTYHKLSFTPTFWTFTFSYAVVISYTLRWLALTQPRGALFFVIILLTGITLFIGSIALRSLCALRQGRFLPSS